MPIGCSSFVPLIAEDLMRRRPGSVLDLGIGMGFWGAVVRQWLDFGVRPWRTILLGVEGWAAYRNPAWELYDQVYTMPIEQFQERHAEPIVHFDAILLLDVLEHFDRADGEHVIDSARRLLSPAGRLYVGTPAVWMEQGAVYGNEFERHRVLWTADELAALGLTVWWDGTADVHGNRMLLAVS